MRGKQVVATKSIISEMMTLRDNSKSMSRIQKVLLLLPGNLADEVLSSD